MARSKYIYTATSGDRLLAICTVKHELRSLLLKQDDVQLTDLTLERYDDGEWLGCDGGLTLELEEDFKFTEDEIAEQLARVETRMAAFWKRNSEKIAQAAKDEEDRKLRERREFDSLRPKMLEFGGQDKP